MARGVMSRRRAKRKVEKPFRDALSDHPLGKCWIAAQHYSITTAQLVDKEVDAVVEAAMASYASQAPRYGAALEPIVAWKALRFALEKTPYIRGRHAPVTERSTDDAEEHVHVTSADKMEKYHLPSTFSDALAGTLATRPITDALARAEIYRDLMEQLHREGRLKAKEGGFLGLERLWVATVKSGQVEFPGGGDHPTNARDAFGLAHIKRSHLVVMYSLAGKAFVLRSNHRPHALDNPGIRFRAWSDGPTAGDRWGAAVHLGYFAQGSEGIDGVPETICRPIRLRADSFSKITVLGYPRSTRGLQEGIDDDKSYLKRIKSDCDRKRIDLDAAAKQLGGVADGA